jgi:sec-independent protein translocase protein TatC
MAERNDELRPESEEAAEGGGVVKTFLEHLEDLRWTLIKSAAATLIGMLICLFNARAMIAVLSWPLHRAAQRHIAFLPDETNQVVTFQIGAARLKPVILKTNRLGSLELGTNPAITLLVEPVEVGGQQLFTLRLAPNPEDADPAGGPGLIYLDPSAPFFSSFHLAFFGGLLLASPFVFYYFGQFLMPALKIREKKYFLRAFIVSLFLFLMGISVAYFVIMPTALKFAQQYAEWMGVSVPYWSAGTYISFVIKFMLGMGLGFLLPVVLLALVKIGILNYRKLASMRRYVIVGNLVLGALLTTPEVLTQVVMAVALQLLYEVSVWIAWYWERQEKKKAEKG